MHFPASATVLLIDLIPENPHLATLKSIFKEAHIEVLILERRLSSCQDQKWLVQVCSEHQPSLVIHLLDQRMSVGHAPLSGFPDSFPLDIPVIVAAQNFQAPQIRTMLELGATDFITPPFTSESILPRVWRLLRHNTLDSAWETLQEELVMQRLGMVGESPAFLEELGKLRLLARCDITVMIGGETGTGKELVARAVHYLSPRADRPFVPLDCGAIPPELTESELFGHERGAFTGAVIRNRGLIAAAAHGTLFLDEVDALNLSVQAKLLRFLQEMEYRPLGSSEIRKADVRVISATNCDLLQKVRNKEFREDLYYRLNVVHLRIPALRQRREDILLLARHFAAKYVTRFNRPPREFSQGALHKLLMYEWPGNVRELENVVEAAVALCDGPLIHARDLSFATAPQCPLSFREAKAQMIAEFEQEYIVRLLDSCGGNVSEAARSAGKNRRAFWELIRKHGIDNRGLRNASVKRATTKATVQAAGFGKESS